MAGNSKNPFTRNTYTHDISDIRSVRLALFKTPAVFSSPYLKPIRNSTRIVLSFLKAFINSIFLSYSDVKVFLHSWNIVKALKKQILVSTAAVVGPSTLNTFEKLFFKVFSIYFSEIFFLAHFYGHANLDFMQMLFVHVFKLFVCAYVQEKHTFVYYKKLLEEIEFY